MPPVFSAGDDTLLQIYRRAARAASRGAASFPVPELQPVAAAIGADPRVAESAAEARGWRENGALYHDLVRLAARYVLELEAQLPAVESVYVPKARGELEPLLALWPDVLALPAIDLISGERMVALRALPVHPLGVVHEASWADGRICSPAEYFFHDLDHARFKVREDLSAAGAARGIWNGYGARAELAQRLLDRIRRLADRALADATLLLLFEVVHAKSFPLDRNVLLRELAGDTHTDKLRSKLLHGFFGPSAPRSDVFRHLDAARLELLEALR